MKAELFITKERIPYVIAELGEGRVTILESGVDQDLVSLEVISSLDLLHMFHAGIQYGSDSMAKTLIR
jgi:hypothetical protein